MSIHNDSSDSSENVAKKGIKKMDAVVTGVILSGIIASIYGVSKLREKEKSTHNTLPDTQVQTPEKKSWWKRLFGKK